MSGYHIAMFWFFGACFVAPAIGAWLDKKEGGQ